MRMLFTIIFALFVSCSQTPEEASFKELEKQFNTKRDIYQMREFARQAKGFLFQVNNEEYRKKVEKWNDIVEKEIYSFEQKRWEEKKPEFEELLVQAKMDGIRFDQQCRQNHCICLASNITQKDIDVFEQHDSKAKKVGLIKKGTEISALELYRHATQLGFGYVSDWEGYKPILIIMQAAEAYWLVYKGGKIDSENLSSLDIVRREKVEGWLYIKSREGIAGWARDNNDAFPRNFNEEGGCGE